jgi:hypothetical protein
VVVISQLRLMLGRIRDGGEVAIGIIVKRMSVTLGIRGTGALTLGIVGVDDTAIKLSNKTPTKSITKEARQRAIT